MQAPVVPMSFLRAKPIGVMQMIDQGEQDDKIIAVHADDPEFRDYDDINQLPKHRLAEIRRLALLHVQTHILPVWPAKATCKPSALSLGPVLALAANGCSYATAKCCCCPLCSVCIHCEPCYRLGSRHRFT